MVPVWLFVNLSACFPTACQQVAIQQYLHDAAEAFDVGKKITGLCKKTFHSSFTLRRGNKPSWEQKREKHRDLQEFSSKMSRAKRVPLCQAW